MKKIVLAALAAAVALPCVSLSGVAAAQPDYRWQGGADRHDWDPARAYRADRRHHHDRRLTRSDYIYRGHDGRYYCRRDDGTTGLVIGAVAGGVLGNAIGNGNTLGTLLGAAAGGAVGRSIDRGDMKCR